MKLPLIELTDLPTEALDLSIGMENGVGGKLRVMERCQRSISGAIGMAAKIAQNEVSKTQGRLVSHTPAALRADPNSDRVELEFDVVSPTRPKAGTRQIQVVVMAKKGSLPSRPRK